MKLTDKLQGVMNSLTTASQRKMNRASIARNWRETKRYWATEWAVVSHKRLYAASALAAAVLFGASYTAISHTQQADNWTQVFSNGTYVGMVPNDPKVLDAMQRIALGYHVDVRFHNVHTHVATDYNWQDVAALPMQATAIAVNGRPLVYTADATTAGRVLAVVQQTLTPKGLKDGASAHFIGHVNVVPAVVGVARVMSSDAAVNYILHPSTQVLAGRSGSIQTVSYTKTSAPTAGAPAPLLQVAVTETVTRVVTLPYPVHYIQDNQLGKGAVKVVQQGHQGQAMQQVEVSYLNGHVVSETVVHQDVVKQPATEVARRGTNSGVADGNWAWPSPCYTVTSGFGWRSLDGGNFHPGVDIGCAIGTPVYASNNGVVLEAGWNSGGYGNWVHINNGNGIETVFGHMSRVAVHAGQVVAKGQVIGYSGNTGFATGPHLHYEVRLNGRPVPPTPYM